MLRAPMRLLRATALVAVCASIVPAPTHASAKPALSADLSKRIASDPGATLGVLVGTQNAATRADLAAMAGLGVKPLRVFDQFDVVYARGTGRSIARLASLGNVARVVENRRIEFFGDREMVATRARDVWESTLSGATPIKIGGQVVDGRGVGVAIVDSGIDGANPDLAPAIAGNKKYVCTTPEVYSADNDLCFGNDRIGAALGTPITGCTDDFWGDVADSDTTGGHGTHVAGIVAGRGVASDGRFTGAAPGAKLYGLGIGEVNQVLYALEAFNWIACNYDKVSPRIRVVNNSWGVPGGSAFDAADPINKAANVLVSKGIVVAFSAGNDGGDGSTDTVSGYAKNPTPGVIGVANYDDGGDASRSASLNSGSSRGKSSDSNRNNWPDISAPGTNIISTGARTGAYVPTGTALEYEPWYTIATGTSMAAPHICGIVALMLQAKPSLTPASVEDILEDHAHQFSTPGGYVSDPANSTNGINYGAGHGLVDAVASLADSRVGAVGGSALPQTSQLPRVYLAGLADPQIISGVQWTVPHGLAVTLAEPALSTGDPTVYPIDTARGSAFRIFPPSGPPMTVAAELTGTSSAGVFDSSAPYTFADPGTYRIESQVNFGAGLRSIDSWVVRVL